MQQGRRGRPCDPLLRNSLPQRVRNPIVDRRSNLEPKQQELAKRFVNIHADRVDVNRFLLIRVPSSYCPVQQWGASRASPRHLRTESVKQDLCPGVSTPHCYWRSTCPGHAACSLPQHSLCLPLQYVPPKVMPVTREKALDNGYEVELVVPKRFDKQVVRLRAYIFHERVARCASLRGKEKRMKRGSAPLSRVRRGPLTSPTSVQSLSIQ